MKTILILDFETYYDQDFTLRAMTPAEYILDRRFEVLMASVKLNDGPHHVIEGPEIPNFLASLDPADTVTVTFNSLFDNSILAWHYGFIPGQMIDAMSMARALDGHKFRRFNLASIAERLGFPAKGDAIKNTKGKRRADFSPEEWQEFKDYAVRDNVICEMIFTHYYPQMPKSELRLMDMVLRACVQPVFRANTKLLEDHLDELALKAAELQARANNIDKKLLLSTVKFKQALIDAGIPEDEIETKISPQTGKPIPAFAKGDPFMERLQNHSDPYVAALATARLGARSRLEETRSRTLLRIGRLPWQDVRNHPQGTLPIPLRYGGAHTHRLSGDWKMNMQNLPRGSKLRYSLEAPPGHSVLTIDLGQIEARLVAWISGCMRLLEEFAKYDAGDKAYDPYNRLASAIFACAVDRKASDPIQRAMGFIGKTGILGLGYGCGRPKFDTMVTQGARLLNVDISTIYSKELTHNAVTVYRERYQPIRDCWRHLHYLLANVLSAAGGDITFGPCLVSRGKILLPSGMYLHYDNIQYVDEMVDFKNNGQPMPRRDYKYEYAGAYYRIHGPKLLENICQALARIIVMEAALRIRKRTGYRFAHQAHDELIYVLPTADLDPLKKIIHEEMTRAPRWALDLPLVADVGVGKSYGDAK